MPWGAYVKYAGCSRPVTELDLLGRIVVVAWSAPGGGAAPALVAPRPARLPMLRLGPSPSCLAKSDRFIAGMLDLSFSRTLR